MRLFNHHHPMHCLYFVLVSTEDAKSAVEARQQAEDELDLHAFTAEGYFGSGKADWYEIGGRWSAVIEGNATILTPEVLARLQKAYPDSSASAGGVEVFIPSAFMEHKLSELDETRTQGNFWIVTVDYHL